MMADASRLRTAAYSYAPGRGGAHAAKLLDGFSGILQVDGYAAYRKLAAPARLGGPVTLVMRAESIYQPVFWGICD